jgi:hypothetical protein
MNLSLREALRRRILLKESSFLSHQVQFILSIVYHLRLYSKFQNFLMLLTKSTMK